MDVKIDRQLVIAEREKRAWSQQHLADAAGLALRTIQRIETGGTGSYESAKAIAACLEISLSVLRVAAEPKAGPLSISSRPAKVAGSVLGASLLAGLAALFFQSAFAEQVLLDVSITREQAVLGQDSKTGTDVRNYQTQLVLESGEEMAMPKEGEFNLVIASTVLDGGKVLLSVKLYEYREQGFELVGEPRVVTSDGKEIEMAFPTRENPERRYRVAVTPQIH
jgi:transcriptional regulator with XRE-family HTH domain